MPSEQVALNLQTLRRTLERKGFGTLLVAHYDNTPPACLALHDDHGRLARGDVGQFERAIESAGDLDGLWSALERAEMTGRPPAR